MVTPSGNVLVSSTFDPGLGSVILTFANPVDPVEINADGIILEKRSVLGIDRARKYIASNYVDGLLFFTNGVDEPKKINIEESFKGTYYATQGLTTPTRLVSNISVGTKIAVEEEHVTVIRKNPDGVLNVTLDDQVGAQEGSVVNVTVGFNDGSGNPQLGHFVNFEAV